MLNYNEPAAFSESTKSWIQIDSCPMPLRNDHPAIGLKEHWHGIDARATCKNLYMSTCKNLDIHRPPPVLGCTLRRGGCPR